MFTFISIIVATIIGAGFGYLVDHLYIWSMIGLVVGVSFSFIAKKLSKIPALLDDLFKV